MAEEGRGRGEIGCWSHWAKMPVVERASRIRPRESAQESESESESEREKFALAWLCRQVGDAQDVMHYVIRTT